MFVDIKNCHLFTAWPSSNYLTSWQKADAVEQSKNLKYSVQKLLRQKLYHAPVSLLQIKKIVEQIQRPTPHNNPIE
ncbi:hypothetical protein CP500_020575 [Tychonema bourrellyi FEM_GT703]|uniref:Uncharacterized protein n=1 Tax=Tychonema bourrellyi FEM_GT703 TaxID=2040638 RepID=A0A2G4EVV2_9CYAN|nr:hypothetical protein CP500_020575 [Tychonema bourrellyi FEM_GT703]